MSERQMEYILRLVYTISLTYSHKSWGIHVRKPCIRYGTAAICTAVREIVDSMLHCKKCVDTTSPNVPSTTMSSTVPSTITDP